MKALLDTQVFLDLVSTKRASPPADLAKHRDLCLSEISAAEIACLVRVGRIELNMEPEEWFFLAVQRAGIELLPVTARLFIRSALFEWENRDPADRLLLQLLMDDESGELTLFTRDRKILEFGKRKRLKVLEA